MSIIASLLTEEVFYIATDTLCCTQDKNGSTGFGAPLLNLHSKITYHPHLKCCVVGLGSGALTEKHRQFIQSIFCKDVSELYHRTKTEFIDSIDITDPDFISQQDNLISMLGIFGYSEVEKKMVAYTVIINKDGNHKFTNHNTKAEGGPTTLMSPRIDIEVENDIMDSILGAGGNIKDALVEVAKKMHADSLVEETHKLTVGGEIHFTIIGFVDGEFVCNISTPYRFPDYDENIDSITEYRRPFESRPQLSKQEKEEVKMEALLLLSSMLKNASMPAYLDARINRVDFESLNQTTKDLISTQTEIMRNLHDFSKTMVEKYGKLLLSIK